MKDINEFLNELGAIPPTGRIEAVATYHDACHLAHAQSITSAPRRLLGMIPGLELRDLPESGICCGSAGTYNLSEAEMSDRLAQRKIDNILSTGADRVGQQRRLSAANPARSPPTQTPAAGDAPDGFARSELSGNAALGKPLEFGACRRYSVTEVEVSAEYAD